jgi:hypothetical protein
MAKNKIVIEKYFIRKNKLDKLNREFLSDLNSGRSTRFNYDSDFFYYVFLVVLSERSKIVLTINLLVRT